MDEEKVPARTLRSSMSLSAPTGPPATVKIEFGPPGRQIDITALTGAPVSARACISAAMPAAVTSATPDAVLVTASALPRPDMNLTSSSSESKKPLCTPT